MTIMATEEFKMTDLGPLPCDWDVAKLRDLVKTVKGRKPTNLTEVATSTSPPYLTAKYFRTGQPTQFVGLSDDSSVIPVNRDDIIFIWDGSNAGDVFTGLAGILASTMVKVAPEGERLYRKYLFYFLKTKFELFNSKTTGSTIPHVSKNLFYDLPVPLPPLPEQKKIAAVLSAVQEAKEKTEAVIKATRELKKSLMKHLFTYGPVSIDQVENIRLKETEIGMVPEEWEVAKLGNVARTQYGYTASACHDNVGPQFLRITDIDDDGNVNWSTVPFCMVSLDDFQKFCLEDGDTVVARIGATTGKTYFVEDPPRSVFASYLIRLKVKDRDKVYPTFIGAFTKSSPYWTQVNQSKGEKLKAGLSARQLEQILIPLPPLQVQKRSIIALSVTEKKLEAERNKKATLQVLFNTMLSRLMTGRIRVNNVEVPV